MITLMNTWEKWTFVDHPSYILPMRIILCSHCINICSYNVIPIQNIRTAALKKLSLFVEKKNFIQREPKRIRNIASEKTASDHLELFSKFTKLEAKH